MAPTIQAGTAPAEKRPPLKPGEKKSDLVCKVKYCNTLPDIPFDLKFIAYPFDSTRFIQYNPTSLERNYRYEVLTEHDMGVTIDLIDREAYACEPGAQLDAADEKLLEEDASTPQDSKRSRHHARNVSWLRRTEYISTEQTRFQPQTMDKVEAKVGYSVKKTLKGDETLYMDRDGQIRAIEKTFEDARTSVEKHYSKPGVVPVEVLPVFPDFELWKYPCAQVIFDSDPAPVGKRAPAQIEEMSQAMIRGVMDESGEQFVAYFLPCEDTLLKRRRDIEAGVPYIDDEEYEYRMAREYNWNVKSKASKGYEENYFFVVRDDGVYYDELETRVRLNKRRQKVGQSVNNTRLVVKHRPLRAIEHRMQRFREKQLEPPGEEDDEDEEDDAVEEDGEGETQETTATQEDNVPSGDDENSVQRPVSRSSRSKSRSRARSGSPTSSRSGSRSRSNSHSVSRSRSGSRSKSRSRSPSRSRSRSKSAARSESHSRSPSGSRSRSRSRSHSQSRSRSRSRSKSGSRSGSGSPSGRSSSGDAASDSE